MNNKAYAEVYQIIQYLPENEYRCIPLEKIKFLEENMDKEVGQICTITTNIEQIELSLEAKKIFISLFYNYIANDNQKVKLKNFLIQEEKKYLEAIYNNIFENKKSKSQCEEQNTSLAVLQKETIFIKIKKILLNIINKIKK